MHEKLNLFSTLKLWRNRNYITNWDRMIDGRQRKVISCGIEKKESDCLSKEKVFSKSHQIHLNSAFVWSCSLIVSSMTSVIHKSVSKMMNCIQHVSKVFSFVANALGLRKEIHRRVDFVNDFTGFESRAQLSSYNSLLNLAR